MLLPPPDTACKMTQEEEDALARRVAEQGDENATIKLYKCCLTDVFYYFYRKTWNDVHETEDLTEDTFLRAVEGLRNGTWSGQLFRAWLFTIARNVFFEWLRRIKRHSAPSRRNGSHPAAEEQQAEEVEQIDLLDEVLIREQGTTLWGLVQQLPEKDQMLLSLRYEHRLPYAEIANLMKCKEGASKTRHWRALNKLREKIVQAGLGEVLRHDKDQ